MLIARRAVDEVDGIEILKDWTWDPTIDKWALLLRITVEVDEKSSFPRSTEWYVFVSERFPRGKIQFYPSVENGLAETYHHQLFNEVVEGCPWTKGEICLTKPVYVLSHTTLQDEPEDGYSRFLWYCQRAKRWLILASNNGLITQGDPFELPDFSIREHDYIIGYRESEDTHKKEKRRVDYGTVILSPFNKTDDLLVAREFRTIKGRSIREVIWGDAVDRKRFHTGIWILLPGVPNLPIWQAPSTWKELHNACNKLGFDLFEIFPKMRALLTDGPERIGLLGMPIPEKFGGPLKGIHW